jgi:uncharacterized protein
VPARRDRPVSVPPPTEQGVASGLAYALHLPDREPAGGVVILHGAGSCKERHFDFARACRAAGLAAVTFDQRGHGESDGALGLDALDDVAAIAALLPPGPVALRGSSMGGWLALAASTVVEVAAVVAICPAPGDGPRRADTPALEALIASVDTTAAAAALGERLLLLHAEGDETVPVGASRDLHAAAPGSCLVVVPGGHHSSVQHDGELQALAVKFIAAAATTRSVRGG